MQTKQTTKTEQQDKARRILVQKVICELTGKISDEKNLERIYRLVFFLWMREV